MTKKLQIQLPHQVQTALNRLEAHGHQAFVVGGCVRDSLLGKTPQDWDITTSALPQAAAASLGTAKIKETGLKHGTITAILEGLPLEITTYRLDGEYSDHRHPNQVIFSTSLQEDLSRRDFTINAMAYNPKFGLVDYFDGESDLQKGIIRCVGNPKERFNEDALRILRALRFAAVLNFSIEENTKKALFTNQKLLQTIAVERINSEFSQLICATNPTEILRNYREIIAVFIPEITPTFNFQQHNPHHIYTIYDHILATVAAIQPTLCLRLAMFCHDLGKPQTFSLVWGVGHFYNHANLSEKLTKEIMNRLHYATKEIQEVCLLVKYHDMQLDNDEYALKRWLNKQGADFLRNLLKVKKADTLGLHPDYHNRIAQLEATEELLEKVITESDCLNLKDLKINGSDLLRLGYKQDKSIGIILNALLDAVLRDEIPNQQAQLLNRAKFYLKQSTYFK